MAEKKEISPKILLDKVTIESAFKYMCTAKTLAEKYEQNKEVTAKYVHATSRGHEAIQIAIGMQLKPYDWVSPYYRDDSLLLGIGISPYELMLQVFAKRDDIFSGGRTNGCIVLGTKAVVPSLFHCPSKSLRYAGGCGQRAAWVGTGEKC